MNEKLTIRTFCGIDNIEIELNDITVLIGPQATGKSICAKSFYFFKRFTLNMRLAISEEKTRKEFDEGLKRQFEEYFPQQSWTPQFMLRYEIADKKNKAPLFIQVKRSTKSGLRITYSEIFKKVFEELTEEHKRIFATKSVEEAEDFKTQYMFDSLFDRAAQTYFRGTQRSQLFIPAGRSFFGILQSSIFSFLATNTAIDPFLKSFGSFYENVKSMQRRKTFGLAEKKSEQQNERLLVLTKKVDALVGEVLKGKYVSEKGKDYLISQDGRKINLTNASSGQQETLPLALILKHLQSRVFIRYGYSIYIEEPEAHIFPAAQKQIIQLISLVYNASKENIPYQFLITTHSPYTLTALNNLIFAAQVLAKNEEIKQQEVYDIVDKDMILDPRKISCYSIKNGQSELIMSEETGLIASDVIDGVSEDLSMEFDKLLELG